MPKIKHFASFGKFMLRTIFLKFVVLIQSSVFCLQTEKKKKFPVYLFSVVTVSWDILKCIVGMTTAGETVITKSLFPLFAFHPIYDIKVIIYLWHPWF